MNILDGTKSFVYGGPSHGDTAEAKLVVASRIGWRPTRSVWLCCGHLGTSGDFSAIRPGICPFIQHAVKIGLGVGSAEQVDLCDAGLGDEIGGIREMLI